MIRTKVVATIGPASASPTVIEALVRAGMDIARINMSHGNYDTHGRSIERVREASERVGRPVALLIDLQGPKIRIGYLPEPVFIRPGATLTIAPEGQHMGEELPTTYMDLAKEVEPGTKVLLDDGLLELVCVGIQGVRAHFEVVRGGILHSKKGINLPTVDVSAPSVTEKDLRDLEFAFEVDAEFVGLSFVRRAKDVQDLKERIKGRAWLVAKIEKAQALEELDGILTHSDAVMVARGDLGVELPFEEVPLAQKSIIQAANGYGRPVITATQMLESMTEYPRPTRAEASDVANAILDGTDAVMLSGETAAGKYPVKAVEAMVRIASEIEKSGVLEMGPRYLRPSVPIERHGASDREHAVASSSVNAARELKSPAMIVFTRGGFSARLVSSYRPPVPIFAICTDPKVHRQLCGVWGIRPILAEGEEVTYENLTTFGKKMVLESGLGKEGDPVVVTAGYPFHRSGSTNTMRVERL